MKLNILTSLLLILFVILAHSQGQTTHLTYFIEHEDQQEEDFIQITLQIEAQSRSLVEAISNAGRVAAEISTIAGGYCKQYAKKSKGDCKDAVDISKFSIEPQYQIVRKEATFSTFIVSHDVTVNAYFPDNIGYLIDSFLKYEDLTLKGFEWKPLEEKDSEEAAIKDGLEQGQGLCDQIGLTLGRIIDIEEVVEEQQEPAEEPEGQEGEEEAEEQPEVIVYKFEVECIPKAKSSKIK